MCDRRLTRRAFVRRVGRLALAAPVSLALFSGFATVAHAGPAHQAGPPTATPAATAGPAVATPTPATATPTPEVPTATPTPASGAPASTATPTAPGAPATPTTAPAQPPTSGLPAGVSRETILTTLRLSHPRIGLSPEDEVRIRRAVSSDLTARGYRDALLRNGSRLLTQPTPERTLIGPRLLAVSRTVLDRVTTLALLYRLDGGSRWAARARDELLAAAAFSDWNPSHFLDVAELSHAFAIGYDWLYDTLTPDDRATIRRALIEKGLRPAEQAYAARAAWTRASHAWNLVCNGGIAMGALAIADEDPALAGTLLAQALESMPRATASYGPGGAWIEGPSSWEYATLYLACTSAALTSALGTDFGLSDAPGLAETGRFGLYQAGPTGLFLNFGDSNPRPSETAILFWLARRFNDPALAVAAREAAASRPSARGLLWYDPRGTAADLAALSLDARYPASQLAFFRSAWNDRDALYVAFKGGNNAAADAHLDLGTFVLDALGQRWAVDLGPDDDTLPGYDGAERWTYERTATSGQNTLMLEGTGQDPNAEAPVLAFQSGVDGGFAIADLTEAYAASGALRVQRGVALRDARSRVLIQDEVELTSPGEVRWSMHTEAVVEIQGERAYLSQGGVVLEARVLSPVGAAFTVEDVQLAPPQRPAIDLRRLLVRVPDATTTQIVVLFTPRQLRIGSNGGTGTPGTTAAVESLGLPEIVPLDRWVIAGVESPADVQT